MEAILLINSDATGVKLPNEATLPLFNNKLNWFSL